MATKPYCDVYNYYEYVNDCISNADGDSQIISVQSIIQRTACIGIKLSKSRRHCI